ncbi:MAG TPA: hypothetical protein VGN23_15985 [Verrucomicrobiae bacterium]|jgi:hypothetical protein
MSVDDPRIKRVLKRYLKGEEFSDATLDLMGISLQELESMCRCNADDFKIPRELDGYGLIFFTNRLGLDFDASKYDYFIHSYVKREFCTPDRATPKELALPCEDGPHVKIPLPKGTHWASARPDDDGFECYVEVDDVPKPHA